MKSLISKCYSSACLVFVFALASCSQHTIIPGRTFYQDEYCIVYESVRSGFLSAVPSLYVKCDDDEPYEILRALDTRYYDAAVELRSGRIRISVDYCNVGDGPRSYHAEDVETRFHTHFDDVEFGGLSLALDFREEPSGCREKRLEEYRRR